jgi:hypothetical protein
VQRVVNFYPCSYPQFRLSRWFDPLAGVILPARGAHMCLSRYYRLRRAGKTFRRATLHIAAAACEGDGSLIVALSLPDLSGAIGPLQNGSRKALSADRAGARLGCLLPPREGSSPRREVPDRRMTGASACIGTQMVGRSEGAARHIDQESDGGPDPRLPPWRSARS